MIDVYELLGRTAYERFCEHMGLKTLDWTLIQENAKNAWIAAALRILTMAYNPPFYADETDYEFEWDGHFKHG